MASSKGKHYYNEYWGSIDHFMMNGIGFCFVNKGKVICEGVSIFKSTVSAEFDILTDSAYRGEGLAYIIGEQFIDACLVGL